MPSREFYDYVAKYRDDTSEPLLPAPLDDETTAATRATAIAAYRALRLRGLPRAALPLRPHSGPNCLH